MNRGLNPVGTQKLGKKRENSTRLFHQHGDDKGTRIAVLRILRFPGFYDIIRSVADTAGRFGRLFLGEQVAIWTVPGLIDPHVHLREPGHTHKEDFTSGTKSALAGGITMVLDMPNTIPPTTTRETLIDKRRLAEEKILCDVGLFIGATNDNPLVGLETARMAVGLKVYASETFGSLRVDDLATLVRIFRSWTGPGPITVHAEGPMLPAAVALARAYGQRLHIAHVSRKSEIDFIRAAKAYGANITCEVTPHHLFLTKDDLAHLGPLGIVKPPLGTKEDQEALWAAVRDGVIDALASDHAPHTLDEKNGSNPPPGVPGLETSLPLMTTALRKRRISRDTLLQLMHFGPKKIYGLPDQQNTHVEIDLSAKWVIKADNLITKCGWTPFEGMEVYGVVKKVVLRDKTVYEDGKIPVNPGFGKLIP